MQIVRNGIEELKKKEAEKQLAHINRNFVHILYENVNVCGTVENSWTKAYVLKC